MDWLQFVSSLVTALAWPAALVALLLYLRRPIRSLFPLIQKLRYKDLELDFGKRVEEVRAELNRELPAQPIGDDSETSRPDQVLLKLIDVAPRAAVVEAWREIEFAALDAARRLGGDRFNDRSLTFRAIKFLEGQPAVDRQVISLLRDLRGLRNEAIHTPEFALSKEAAIDYAASAARVISYLKTLGTTPDAGN